MSYETDMKAAGIGYLPLHCPRHQSAGYNEQIVFQNVNLTASTFRAQVRVSPDSPALITAMNIGIVSMIGSNTIVPISLTQVQTKAMPAANETGDRVTLYWDFWMDGNVILAGEFYVVAGVNQ